MLGTTRGCLTERVGDLVDDLFQHGEPERKDDDSAPATRSGCRRDDRRSADSPRPASAPILVGTRELQGLTTGSKLAGDHRSDASGADDCRGHDGDLRPVRNFIGFARWPVIGGPIPLRIRRLSHFDQVTIGITDVATDLVLVLLRRRQELSTTRAPFGIHGMHVSYSNVEETADPVGIDRRLQGDRRLVVGRASPTLMMIQLFDSWTYLSPPGPKNASLPPSTSV